MNLSATDSARSTSGEKRKRDTQSEPVEKQPTVGTALTRKESEVHLLIDSLGDLIHKKIKTSSNQGNQDVSVYKKKIVELESKIKNLKVEIYDAKEALMQCKLERDEGKAAAAMQDTSLVQVEELKKRARGLKAQLAIAVQNEKKLQEEAERHRAEHVVVLESLSQKNNTYAAELVETKQELEQARSELTKHQDAHLREVGKMKLELKNVQEALVKKTTDHGALFKAFQETKDMNESIMKKSQPLILEKVQLQEEVVTLGAQYNALLSEHTTKTRTLNEEVSKLKASLAQANEEKAKSEKEKNEIELQFLRLKHGPVLSHSAPLSTNSNVVLSDLSVIPSGVSLPAFVPHANSVDDVSVLSEATNHTDRRAAKALSSVVSPSRRVVYDTSSSNLSANESKISTKITQPTVTFVNNTSLTGQKTSSSELCKHYAVVITTTQPIEIPAIRAEADQLGNVVDARILPGGTGYKVEYDDADDASLAVYKLNNRLVDGVTLFCQPFFPATPLVANSTNIGVLSHTRVVDKSNEEDKPHLRLAFFRHNAPEKYKISQNGMFQELKRYGEVLNLKRTADNEGFMAEFRHAADARSVVKNFVPSMNGFRIYCRSHYNHLPPASIEPVSQSDTDRDEVPRGLILRDPALSDHRTARSSSVPRCQACADANRMQLVNTHTTERCRFVLGTKRSTDRSAKGSSSNGGGTSDSNGGSNCSRSRRSDSPERPHISRSHVSDRERDSSNSSRSSGPRSNSSSENAETGGGLIVNGGVRPLTVPR